MLDDFWAEIARQIQALQTATSADDVLTILPKSPNASGDGFFGGSGGDESVYEALLEAGWNIDWYEADYHYALTAPDGQSAITYVEGDIYRGSRR